MKLRLIALALACTAAAACGLAAYEPDGVLIDGLWVGEPVSCDDLDNDGLPGCERVVACGTRNEFDGDPPELRSAAVHARPTRTKDGTLLTYGSGGWIVVFTLTNGMQRASYVIETDPGKCEGSS